MLLWATRGRAWGTTFLLRGGLADPLPVYQRAFAGREDEESLLKQVDQLVAVRFADPEGRKDRAGRLIFHDFVLEATDAAEVCAEWESLEEAVAYLWPQVSTHFAGVWDSEQRPQAFD